MKKLAVLALFVSMNAFAAEVKITDAKYDAQSGIIAVGVATTGACGAEISFRVRGCTDLLVPYTCFIDVNADGGEACDQTRHSSETVSIDVLNLRMRELSHGTLVFQNKKGKSRKYITLPNIR